MIPFNDFPPEICHMKFPGRFYCWHADLFDQSAHFTLNQPQQWCESLPNSETTIGPFLKLKPNCDPHFQSTDLDQALWAYFLVNLQISTASLVASDVHIKVTNNYQCTVKVSTGACSYSTYVHNW
jgi:hypothetical protein